jgi:branched-chain amino acid aminotransferase
MIVWINGRFVEEAQALISVFDRSFLYGDGLFETLRVSRGQPFRWQLHWDRLQRGAEYLHLRIPVAAEILLRAALELVQQNAMPEALLRISLSRGIGRRGYSAQGADQPSLVMFLHPVPEPDGRMLQGWRLRTSSHRLPAREPLAQFKTCNKLPQILARLEADANDAHEALLLNTDGYIVEGASSNLFWIEVDQVCTPPLAAGILPGVTRAVVGELCSRLGIGMSEKNIFPEKLEQSQGVFLSLSSMGIVEALSLDGRPLPRSELTASLHSAYLALLRNEPS